MRASIAVAWVSHHYFVSWCVKMRKREREEGMVERGKEVGGEVHAPDLSASAAMLTITSGRASKMTRSTPIGHETR